MLVAGGTMVPGTTACNSNTPSSNQHTPHKNSGVKLVLAREVTQDTYSVRGLSTPPEANVLPSKYR